VLLLQAEIHFDLPDKNPNALGHDLAVGRPLRPALNFGNDFLFSGSIIVDDKAVTTIERGHFYVFTIEMPTVNNEAYDMIKDYVAINNVFKLQAASKVIGEGKILDFIFE
jgi:hypothetical protein